MHSFICKSVRGSLVPEQSNKIKFLQKLLNSYEQLDKKFKVTIEVIDKNLNESQLSLYNAFIIKASQHFGNTFKDMEEILFRFFPIDIDTNKPKFVVKWTTAELNTFIQQASALLAEQGFKFE